MLKSYEKMKRLAISAQKKLYDNKGQGALDTAVTVLIAVVLGALILAGLYALLDDTVMPTLTKKIQEMFNYKN